VSFSPVKQVLKNYILNPNAEVDVSGWTTFADGAVATPGDMTGSSPNTTWARNTSSPGTNLSDFLLTKSSGASRQGEGAVYTTLALNASDLGRVLEFSFDYKVASGTYVDDALQVWAYDVANATAIQLAPVNIKNVSTWTSMRCTFQTATNATTYRIGFFIPVTTDSANTIQFCNFYLGRQQKSIGSIVTDWVSYTPTGSWVTNTTYTGMWRRVGDTMEIDLKIATSGAPTAANLTVNLPSGYSIDTAKLTQSNNYKIFGVGTINDNDSADLFCAAGYNSTTSIAIMTYDDGATGLTIGNVSATNPITFAASDYITVKLEGIPISGWSAGAELSSQSAEGRVVAARYYLGSSVTGTADAIAKYNTLVYDTHSAYNTTTGLYTCPVPGYYAVNASMYLLNSSSPNDDYIDLQRDGVAYARAFGHKSTSEAAGESFSSLSDVLYCNAGQTLAIYVNGDASHDQYAGLQSAINIFRLSGNQTIAASETVAAAYSSSAATAVVSGNAIPFATKLYDSHGGYNTSTGVYTCPVSGKYQVTATTLTASVSTSAGEVYGITVTQAGSASVVREGVYDRAQATVTKPFYAGVNASFNCIAGDTLTVKWSENIGAVNLSADGNQNHLEIIRVGNY